MSSSRSGRDRNGTYQQLRAHNSTRAIRRGLTHHSDISRNSHTSPATLHINGVTYVPLRRSSTTSAEAIPTPSEMRAMYRSTSTTTSPPQWHRRGKGRSLSRPRSNNSNHLSVNDAGKDRFISNEPIEYRQAATSTRNGIVTRSSSRSTSDELLDDSQRQLTKKRKRATTDALSSNSHGAVNNTQERVFDDVDDAENYSRDTKNLQRSEYLTERRQRRERGRHSRPSRSPHPSRRRRASVAMQQPLIVRRGMQLVSGNYGYDDDGNDFTYPDSTSRVHEEKEGGLPRHQWSNSSRYRLKEGQFTILQPTNGRTSESSWASGERSRSDGATSPVCFSTGSGNGGEDSDTASSSTGSSSHRHLQSLSPVAPERDSQRSLGQERKYGDGGHNGGSADNVPSTTLDSTPSVINASNSTIANTNNAASVNRPKNSRGVSDKDDGGRGNNDGRDHRERNDDERKEGSGGVRDNNGEDSAGEHSAPKYDQSPPSQQELFRRSCEQVKATFTLKFKCYDNDPERRPYAIKVKTTLDITLANILSHHESFSDAEQERGRFITRLMKQGMKVNPVVEQRQWHYEEDQNNVKLFRKISELFPEKLHKVATGFTYLFSAMAFGLSTGLVLYFVIGPALTASVVGAATLFATAIVLPPRIRHSFRNFITRILRFVTRSPALVSLPVDEYVSLTDHYQSISAKEQLDDTSITERELFVNEYQPHLKSSLNINHIDTFFHKIPSCQTPKKTRMLQGKSETEFELNALRYAIDFVRARNLRGKLGETVDDFEGIHTCLTNYNANANPKMRKNVKDVARRARFAIEGSCFSEDENKKQDNVMLLEEIAKDLTHGELWWRPWWVNEYGIPLLAAVAAVAACVILIHFIIWPLFFHCVLQYHLAGWFAQHVMEASVCSFIAPTPASVAFNRTAESTCRNKVYDHVMKIGRHTAQHSATANWSSKEGLAQEEREERSCLYNRMGMRPK